MPPVGEELQGHCSSSLGTGRRTTAASSEDRNQVTQALRTQSKSPG